MVRSGRGLETRLQRRLRIRRVLRGVVLRRVVLRWAVLRWGRLWHAFPGEVRQSGPHVGHLRGDTFETGVEVRERPPDGVGLVRVHV